MIAKCERFGKCPFFNGTLKNIPAIKEKLIDQFCNNEYRNCARFMVVEKMGEENVPDDLFPHHRCRADTLISNDLIKE